MTPPAARKIRTDRASSDRIVGDAWTTTVVTVPLPLSRRWTVAALLTLTVVTGLVDAVSILRLGQVFVANMTGNIVFLGLSLNPTSGLSASTSLVAICGFVLGALLGGRAAAHLSHRPRQWLCTTFATQTFILAAAASLIGTGVLPLDGNGRYATVAVLAIASLSSP